MFVQIVKFKLKPDTSRDVFLDLTQQMIAWLKGRTGFIAYELYESSDGWFDRIVWEDQQSAQDGLKDFLTAAIAQELICLVENDYNSFFGQAIVSAQVEPSNPTLQSNEAPQIQGHS